MVATGASNVAGSKSFSMRIRGMLDTSQIEQGFGRIKKFFGGMRGKMKSFSGDVKRVALTVSRLTKQLIKMGLAGTTAIFAIARNAPAVAPAMAKMSVSFGKIQRSLGEALAPAFERVAGWMDKLATWVDNNKDKIGDVANKFLDWAEAMGDKLWPVLKDIGNWAADHPGLFAGIVAGLALGPTIIGGISAISGLITTMAGATISASLLAAFGYMALLGGIAYGGFKGAEALVSKAQAYTGMGIDPNAPTDISGQTLAGRFQQKLIADVKGEAAPWEDPLNPFSPAHEKAISEIKAGGFQPTPDGMISAAENRRWFMLQWWDSVWG